MIKINADHIKTKLDYPYYLIVGSDPYLRNFTQNELLTNFKQNSFDDKQTFVIDNQLEWQTVYDSCQSMSLFSNKTLIILDFADNALNTTVATKLNTLTTLLNADIALIIILTKISKSQEGAVWFKALVDKLVVVNCTTPDTNLLPQWIKNYLSQNEIKIEAEAIGLLCYFYEGNLLALTQLLEQLKLRYPNQLITYQQIEKNINDSTVFSPFHWIDAMLTNKIKRAIHILQQLKVDGVEPLILLRTVQRELILIINLKKASVKQPIKLLFDNYKIWQNRRAIYTNYLNRVTIDDLYTSLAKLTNIEIGLKTDYTLLIWEQLELFAMQFMGHGLSVDTR
ncbi:DNA polymerase III subunit delta [Orbaceae bacterium ESL0721]|nr:DNA polymerase III subunit delta [Orbaceae bacterium ESL0721]